MNECLVLSLSHCSLQSPPPRTPAAAAASEKSLPVAVRRILLLVVIMYVCSVCDRGYISLAGRYSGARSCNVFPCLCFAGRGRESAASSHSRRHSAGKRDF